METKTFTTLYVGNLKIDDLYALNKSTIDYATTANGNLGDIAKATLTQLTADNVTMGEQMNKPAKSIYTEQIVVAGTDRSDRFNEIKRNVATAIKSRDETKKAAGNTVEHFLSSYWDTEKKAINTQTSVFAEMIDKYNANTSLKTASETIGIADMMTGLETSNNNFDALYQLRNKEEAEQQSPSASSLKPAAVKSYEQFCTAIEQSVNFAPTESLTQLFKQMDELRKKYAKFNGKAKENENGTTVAEEQPNEN